MVDFFKELDAHFCILSESWMVDANGLEEQLADLEGGTGLKLLYKNRPPRNSKKKTVRTRGGE